MPLRTAIYARPSAAYPLSIDHQITALRELAADRGWTVSAVHRDSMAGGGKGNRRPGLAGLLEGIKSGSCEALLVQSLYLLGRNLCEFVTLLDAVRVAGVRVIGVDQDLDTDRAGHGVLLNAAGLMLAYCRFQRREAIKAGQQRAQQQGVTLGRPTLDEKRVARVKDALISGVGVRPAGRLAGVSPTAVMRVRDDMRAAGQLPAR